MKIGLTENILLIREIGRDCNLIAYFGFENSVYFYAYDNISGEILIRLSREEGEKGIGFVFRESKQFLNYLKKMNGEIIEINPSEDGIILKDANTNIVIPYIEKISFESVEELIKSLSGRKFLVLYKSFLSEKGSFVEIKLSEEEFLNLMEWMIVASKFTINSKYPVFEYVLLNFGDNIEVVGTEGHYLIEFSLENSSGYRGKLFIPNNFLFLIEKIKQLEKDLRLIKILMDEETGVYLVFSGNKFFKEISFYCYGSSGLNYPDYQRVFAKVGTGKPISFIDKKSILNFLRKIKVDEIVLSFNEKTRAVLKAKENNTLYKLETVVNSEFFGEFALTNRLFMQVLKTIRGNVVKCEFIDMKNPIYFYDKNMRIALMPREI